MAGFDKVDPANACLTCCAVHGVRGTDPCMTDEWVSHLIEKCQYADWTREFPWSEKTS
jgi:hypothetical protein